MEVFMINKIKKITVKNNEDYSRKLILEFLNQKKIIFITNKFEKKNKFLDENNY